MDNFKIEKPQNVRLNLTGNKPGAVFALGWLPRRLSHFVIREVRRVQIRLEKKEDRAAIQAVNESVFGAPAEANLVVALREQAQLVISLVADDRGAIVGHIMFSPVALIGHPELKIMGLAYSWSRNCSQVI